MDVNGDQVVSPMDAVNVINAINVYGALDLTPAAADLLDTSLRVDTNNDLMLTPYDALIVVNELNRLASERLEAYAEGEPPAAGFPHDSAQREAGSTSVFKGLRQDTWVSLSEPDSRKSLHTPHVVSNARSASMRPVVPSSLTAASKRWDAIPVIVDDSARESGTSERDLLFQDLDSRLFETDLESSLSVIAADVVEEWYRR
jgi:hypothetical protein